LQPLFNSTVRSAYKLGRKAQSAVGEIQERVNDITAEVKAEEVVKSAETAEAATKPTTIANV
jgi:Sec-independent protein translocase protein TatA